MLMPKIDMQYAVVFVADIDAGRVSALQYKSSEADSYCQDALRLMSDDPSSCGYTDEQWALCQYYSGLSSAFCS